MRWREADNHVLLGPADRAYVLERREEKAFDATTVIFGDGQNGARLPTGVENVTAVYRSGLGQAGNVPAGRIKQLATRPLGVRDVINALPATGGADREGRDAARANAPLRDGLPSPSETRQRLRPRAMTTRWISFVPS